MSAKYLLVFVAVLAVVHAVPTAPMKKCVPEQSEYIIAGRIAQVAMGVPGTYILVGTYSADYKNRKEATVETVLERSGKFVANYTSIRVNEMSYLVDPANKKCTAEKVPPMDRFCTDSPGLKYETSWRSGRQMTDTYRYEQPEANRTTTITLFREGMILASAVVDQIYKGIPQQITMAYGNFTMGIKDDTVFKLPSYCKDD
ncbi:uncharacterized protein [Watersipora subatra]|uniref:uncharacterized protein n=1 Tax=Watersipora subatra TaxID=2589382 RepID=UPI00355C54F3